MWVSVSDPCSGEPRCPLVPKLTNWFGSSRSGRRSKYSRSSRTGSISISFGAGFPASGEIVIGRSSLWYRTGFGVPDLGGILRDRPVARELARTRHIQYCLARPFVSVGIQLGQPVVGLKIRSEIREMHVVVAMCYQCIVNRSEYAGFIAAEIVCGDQVQCGAGFGLVMVMPVWIIPSAAAFDLSRRQPEQEEILLAGLLDHLDRGTIARADCQSSVHHKFHVAGAAGLVTCCGNLV